MNLNKFCGSVAVFRNMLLLASGLSWSGQRTDRMSYGCDHPAAGTS
ncbi:MAG TPA: hypothetical protein VKF42_07365 [Chitinivibrionales bacterium]|nr:hypothetical protein [Chitinivibrionales bacterium]